jgi:hypothetical protein
MAELEPAGQTREIKHYNRGMTPRSQESRQSGRLLKHPPVVTPEEHPETTMHRIFKTMDLEESDDYRTIVALLTTYQRKGDNRAWDDFRTKFPVPLLKLFGDLLIECRRNGFIYPRAEGDRLIWRQVIGNNTEGNLDLCTMCIRPCARREEIDTGKFKWKRMEDPLAREKPTCWE